MTFNSLFVDRMAPQLLKPDYNEVFRYMGYSLKDRTELTDEVRPIVYEVVPQIQNILTPQAVYVSYPLKIENDVLHFGNYEVKSKELARFERNCSAIYLFAATLGPKIDQAIQKQQKLDPVRGVIMQAAGAMYIEKYCDILCQKISAEVKAVGCKTKNRFSPGFADVPLETQKLFFKVLDCSHKIGLTLMDTLIMAPEKSVTAFVGVESIKSTEGIEKGE
ncbi:MAG: hypothetical protein MJ196_01525 [Treponemataceae bacterium]|nr:hypothetical protein [Treponemataceae bacterium]